MITTIAIIWASSASALGIWAGRYAMSLENRNVQLAGELAEEMVGRAIWRNRAQIAERQLDVIHTARHYSAKNARAAQIQQGRAKLAATTARLEQGL